METVKRRTREVKFTFGSNRILRYNITHVNLQRRLPHFHVENNIRVRNMHYAGILTTN